MNSLLITFETSHILFVYTVKFSHVLLTRILLYDINYFFGVQLNSFKYIYATPAIQSYIVGNEF